jgi:sulfofructose kinase
MIFPFQTLPVNDFDVVGFGTNAVDYLIRVPEYPAFNSKVELTGVVQSAGGEVASTMVGLQRLCLTTAYAGRFGGDREGEIGVRSLKDESVDVTYAETVPAAQTQIAFIVIDERSGERTIIWRRDEGLAYRAAEAPVKAATRGRILHMTPHDTAACIEMARAAKARGVIVSIDIDNIFEGIDELLPLVDVCIASAEFSQKLTGRAQHEAGLREIVSRFGCAVAGLTLGAAGSLLLCQGSFISTAGYKAPGGCVDTTGAGDAFRTGFLYGMLTGESVEKSAELANAVAAIKCSGSGARSALPGKDELMAFMREV